MSSADIQIEDFLPQRGSMLLLDHVVHVDEIGGIFRAKANDQWPLIDQRGVNPMVLIELVAQGGGVCISWNIQKQHEKMPSSGWIVGVKQASFYVNFIPVGATIETRVTLGHHYDNLRELIGTAHVGTTLAGEMTLQVILGE